MHHHSYGSGVNKMAFVRVSGSDDSNKFLEILQNDLKNLSIETKKKFPQIKEVCIS